MNKLIRLLTNFPLGIFLGCAISFSLFLLLEQSAADFFRKFYTFVFSALISLLAAAGALARVLANIENQNKNQRNDRSRRLASARAMLPNALSNFVEIAKKRRYLFSHF